jgi:hypothetical protein
VQEPQVRGQAVAALDGHHVPRHQLGRVHGKALAAADDVGCSRGGVWGGVLRCLRGSSWGGGAVGKSPLPTLLVALSGQRPGCGSPCRFPLPNPRSSRRPVGPPRRHRQPRWPPKSEAAGAGIKPLPPVDESMALIASAAFSALPSWTRPGGRGLWGSSGGGLGPVVAGAGGGLPCAGGAGADGGPGLPAPRQKCVMQARGPTDGHVDGDHADDEARLNPLLGGLGGGRCCAPFRDGS